MLLKHFPIDHRWQTNHITSYCAVKLCSYVQEVPFSNNYIVLTYTFCFQMLCLLLSIALNIDSLANSTEFLRWQSFIPSIWFATFPRLGIKTTLLVISSTCIHLCPLILIQLDFVESSHGLRCLSSFFLSLLKATITPEP